VTTPPGQQPEYPRPDDEPSSPHAGGSSSYGQPAGSGQPWDAQPQQQPYTQQFPAPGQPPAYPQQGYPQQGYPQQGYPQQGYPQQQGYPGAPAGYDQGAPAKSNGLGIAALVIGILAILGAFVGAIPGILLGLLAIVLGVLGLRRVKARRADNKGMALAGLITGIIGLVLGAIFLAAAIWFATNAEDCITDLDRTGDQAQYQQCIQDTLTD